VDDDTAGRAVLAGRERLARLTRATVVGAPG
jgi:hypothetical protein